jgi:2-polyprenyl-6-methoxyphenol hydroxylase-like FAD-dependent oxidoreductase
MRVTIVGGGVAGLLTAMLLGNDGHQITLLERDPFEPPEEPTAAWDAWERRGVNQFRLLHYFAPQFRRLLEAELPTAVEHLDAAGALRYNPMALAPESITGGFQPGDEDFEALTARRPVAEAALARAAATMPNVTIRRGVATAGLLAGRPEGDAPHVVGVRLDSGEEIASDLVVDASGRRSQLPAWLAALGARPPVEEVEDSGFIYYGRHFRSADGSVPAMLGGLLTAVGSMSVLSLPADNGTWGLGLITSAGDSALRRLKEPDTWTRVARSFPLHAHWTDGEPLDDVAVMAKIEDRHRCYVVDGAPVATGALAVGDAWACTNPSLGRGASLGFMHAAALRDSLRTADDPAELPLVFHAATEASLEPWYRATVSFDRHRLNEMNATVRGDSYEPEDPLWEITQAMQASMVDDPEIFRAFLRIASVLSPAEEVLARPRLLRKVIKLGSGWRDAPIPGPTRSELLELVDA